MPETQNELPPVNPSEQNNAPKKQEATWEQIRNFIGLENRISRKVLFIATAIVLSVAALSFMLTPPSLFSSNSRFIVKDGMSLGEVSLLLKTENLVRSRVLFEFCAITLRGDKKIMAGEYLFKEPLGGCAMAARITGGVFGIPSVRVTIPEGLSNKNSAVILAKSLSRFDSATFIKSAGDQEGFLFPDTYFFAEGVTAADVQTRMRANFDKKIKPLATDIEKSGHTLREIITMASIIEKEVASEEDRAIVSGILWKRIGRSMPLQVDATFMYLLNKKSSELTQTDLQMKSPYNTYRNKGLPPGPIGNPGISAINAALNPKASPYLYYLSDTSGITHYAKTFDEHKANKEKYLR